MLPTVLFWKRKLSQVMVTDMPHAIVQQQAKPIFPIILVVTILAKKY